MEYVECMQYMAYFFFFYIYTPQLSSALAARNAESTCLKSFFTPPVSKRCPALKVGVRVGRSAKAGGSMEMQ